MGFQDIFDTKAKIALQQQQQSNSNTTVNHESMSCQHRKIMPAELREQTLH